MRVPRIVGGDDCFDLHFDGDEATDRAALIEEYLAVCEDDHADNYEPDPR